jgi:hypothetical protein
VNVIVVDVIVDGDGGRRARRRGRLRVGHDFALLAAAANLARLAALGVGCGCDKAD